MAFDLTIWKEKVQQRLHDWKPRMKPTGVASVYAFISAAAMWPVVEAAQAGEWAALAALGGVLSGLGSNLLANQIQNWKDEGDAAKDLAQAVPENSQLRAELDAVLEQLDAFNLAGQALSEEDRQWFAETLKSELEQIDSGISYDAIVIGGVSAQGEGANAAGKRGVVAENVGGHVVTGDHVTINELPPPVLKMFANQFGFDPETSDAEALQSYFNNVIFERHSKLSFLFIEPKTGKVYTEADIEDVFVPLQLVNPKISERLDHKHGREVFRQLAEGDNALSPLTLPNVLADHDCILLRGKPGSGKTTLLRHIALSFARQEHQTNLNWKGSVPLPLMIPLRNFSAFLQRKNRDGGYLGPQPRALLEYLQESLRGADVRFSPEFLSERLQEGQCLLLLDALDEVSGELGNGGDLRAAVARQVSAFIRHYRSKGNRFVLTSRPRAYQDESVIRRALPQPQVFDVLDLGRDSYHQLITNLLSVLTGSPEFGRREANDLSKRVMRNQQLADLASNPLLCTTLVLVYKYYGRRLPERRVDVLDEVVTLLLGRWEEERQYVFSPDELVKAAAMKNEKIK